MEKRNTTKNPVPCDAAAVEDDEAWETLTKCFEEVQSLLDRNRCLIQQVNDNHRSMIPENLTRNVDLICEINSNISKVVELYSKLSADFSAISRRWRAKRFEL